MRWLFCLLLASCTTPVLAQVGARVQIGVNQHVIAAGLFCGPRGCNRPPLSLFPQQQQPYPQQQQPYPANPVGQPGTPVFTPRPPQTAPIVPPQTPVPTPVQPVPDWQKWQEDQKQFQQVLIQQNSKIDATLQALIVAYEEKPRCPECNLEPISTKLDQLIVVTTQLQKAQIEPKPTEPSNADVLQAIQDVKLTVLQTEQQQAPPMVDADLGSEQDGNSGQTGLPLIVVVSDFWCEGCTEVVARARELKAIGRNIKIVRSFGQVSGVPSNTKIVIKGLPAIYDFNTNVAVTGRDECLRILASF